MPIGFRTLWEAAAGSSRRTALANKLVARCKPNNDDEQGNDAAAEKAAQRQAQEIFLNLQLKALDYQGHGRRDRRKAEKDAFDALGAAFS